ncbi:hypothetical protein H2202_008503 [Exophiala xenobiotica]|nr:hypothetical protein H2202_008503 [Exophiala xenobiotica]
MTARQTPTPVKAPAHVLSLLNRLHKLSSDQEEAIKAEDYKPEGLDNFMRDKFIALDQDKCEFVYQVCLAINAKNIVEAGTSFGVSTIYLALAVFNNTKSGTAPPGTVIATEWEKSKAHKAREHWREVGDEITKCIDLREGDLLETLKDGLPEVDLLLLDIWAPLALPVLKLVQPRMRRGAVVIVDNTISSAARYKDLLAYLRASDSGFTNLTLPYTKGLEVSVYMP